jgi:hypothetical protein
MANFDKFYTKPEVAEKCVNFLKTFIDISDKICLEPSAGSGVFLPLLPQYEAYDLIPEGDNIVKQDFLKLSPQHINYITVGNPPFGSRSKMAIDFFNHAAKFSDVIAFIVPVSFMKWNVQKELNGEFALVGYEYLAPNSFLDRGKEFSVRCVFQVWIRRDLSKLPDLRLKKSPPIKHPDFEIWQYNATPQALGTVEENWEIATYRQGYHDYNKHFTRDNYDYVKKCMTGEENGKKQQFFFIKPLTDTAKEIIYNMDFNALAERNTSTPGFGKGDFVSYYIELKERNNH